MLVVADLLDFITAIMDPAWYSFFKNRTECFACYFSARQRIKSGQSMNTYITVWNIAVVHLFLPQLEQQIPVLLIERSRVREKSSGQKNIPHQINNLILKVFAACCPTKLCVKSY